MFQAGSHHLDYISHIYGYGNERPNLVRVLTFHRVGEPAKTPHLDPRQISATTAMFDKQMRFLAGHYRVVSMEQVLEAVDNGARLPKRAVLITFDDACCDIKENAWPILKKYRLPATVFVPTAFPGQPQRAFWWDRLYRAIMFTLETGLHGSPVGNLSFATTEDRQQSLRRLYTYIKTLGHEEAMTFVDEISTKLNRKHSDQRTVLTWDELRNLAKEGLDIGAHTQTHPIMTQIPLPKVRQEVRGSLQDLRREIGNILPTFAYPNGNYNKEIMNILAEEGIRLAFTTRDGFNNLNEANPLSLRRTNITRRTTLPVFRLRLYKWFSYIDVQRHQEI